MPEIDGVTSEGPTKSHQRRDVALDDALLGVLTKRRTDHEAYAAVVGTTLVVDPFILSPVATGGRPFVPDTLTDYYRRTAKQLGTATHFYELWQFRGRHRCADRGRPPRPRRRLGDPAGLRACTRGARPRYGLGTQFCGPRHDFSGRRLMPQVAVEHSVGPGHAQARRTTIEGRLLPSCGQGAPRSATL